MAIVSTVMTTPALRHYMARARLKAAAVAPESSARA
jgi:hypothetical protein